MPIRSSDIKLKRPPINSTAPKSARRMINISGVDHLTNEIMNWYDLPTEDIAAVITQVIQRIDQNNVEMRERFMRYARLYGNYEALGFANLTNTNTFQQTNNLPVYNIIQSCVDTLLSKMVRDNPRPYFITSGADYFDKLKAEKMNQFVAGTFQANNLYEVANNKVFRDSLVYGLGALQFFHNKEKNIIDCEWVFIDELKIDMYDAQKGKPRSMHRCKMVPKEVLIAQYPDQKDVIESVSTNHPNLFKSNDTVIDFVVYTESWHLAIGEGKDRHMGRHVVSLTNKVLLDEEYDESEFPIAFIQFYQKPVGIYGRSITEAILSGQIEINKILFFIQQCQELQASPLIVVDSDSQISPASLLGNRIARMVKVRSGTMEPKFISPQSCGPEIYQHLKDWMTWCYNEVGISQTSASGTKQPGVDSAVAMRTMVDIESSRFIQVSKNWEQFFVKCAEITVRIAKKIYESDKTLSVKYTDKKSKIIKEIPWSKIDLPEDMFTIKCDTISSFPTSAAGRIQTITDFISNNFISHERGMELLQIDPDVEDEMKLQTSSLRLTEKRLCEMVEDNLYSHPEKYLNLKVALPVSLATYNQLCLDNCPEDRLELVRNWISELATMLSGTDQTTQLLQQAFAPPASAPAPISPQSGLSPARQSIPQ